MFSKSEVHCQYCQCPKGVWKKGSFKTYPGDNECKLYDDFSNVIWEFEKAIKPFNIRDIIDRCRAAFELEYADIPDFEATINEMIMINNEEGYMPNNYRPLTVCNPIATDV